MQCRGVNKRFIEYNKHFTGLFFGKNAVGVRFTHRTDFEIK
jgi:hypothetical protein